MFSYTQDLLFSIFPLTFVHSTGSPRVGGPTTRLARCRHEVLTRHLAGLNGLPRLQVQVGWSERSFNPFIVASKRPPKEQVRLVRPTIRLMMVSVRIAAFLLTTMPFLFCSQFVVKSHTRKSIDFRLAQSRRFSFQFISKWLLGERVIRSGKVKVVKFGRQSSIISRRVISNRLNGLKKLRSTLEIATGENSPRTERSLQRVSERLFKKCLLGDGFRLSCLLR